MNSYPEAMEVFARSREDIDFMSDDFEPVSDPIVEEIINDQSLNGVQNSNVLPLEDEIKIPNSPSRRQDDTRRGHRKQGRGTQNTYEHIPGQAASNMATAPKLDKSPALQSAISTASDSTLQKASYAKPLLKETINSPIRMPAVRGDRSLTGGLSVVKLTEAELTAKFERMRIINASRTEKHRLQQADKAAFQSRVDEIARGNREKEIKERAQQVEMEKERSKNREHKIKGINRREWDSGKKESDVIDCRKAPTNEYVKYGHGDIKKFGLKNNQFMGEKFQNNDRISVVSNKDLGGYPSHVKTPIFTSTIEFPSIPAKNEQKSVTPHTAIKDCPPMTISKMSPTLLDREDTILVPTVKMSQSISYSHALRSAETAEQLKKHGNQSESRPRKESRDWAEEMSVPYEENKSGSSAT